MNKKTLIQILKIIVNPFFAIYLVGLVMLFFFTPSEAPIVLFILVYSQFFVIYFAPEIWKFIKKIKVMLIKPTRLAVTFLLLGVFTPSPARALDMEFYTYGGFTPVELAWEKIALIFSDANYVSLFFVTMTMGIFFGAVGAIFNLLRGGKGSVFSWAWPVGLGILIVMGLIIPKGSLTVYDPVLNRFQTINGIPNGIIAVAGVLNKIERIVVEITNTSGGVQSYKDSAGGVGFQALAVATGSAPTLGDEFLTRTLDEYNEKCLLFELIRPGTILTYEKIKNQSTNFMTEWAEASNPAVFTVVYTPGNPTGEPKTCDKAWANIAAMLNAPAFHEKAVKSTCAGAGFNVENPLELQRCQDIMGKTVDFIHGTSGFTAQNFLRQAGMAKSLEFTLLRLSPDMTVVAQANQSMMTSGLGMFVHANEWLPAARGAATAIAIAILPFICLFLPTGVFPKAASILGGFFLWLTAWGIVDATIHSVATTLAQREYEVVRQHALGYTAIMLYPDASLKALAMFGTIRSAGIMLATVLTTMFVRFGGHALALLAGNITGQMQAAGTAAARTANTLEGAAAADEAWRSSIPTMANAGKFSFDADTAARTALRMGQTGGAIEAVSAMGGVGPAAKTLGEAAAARIIGDAARGAGQYGAGLEKLAELKYTEGGAEVEGFRKFEDMVGPENVQKVMTKAAAGSRLRDAVAGGATLETHAASGGGKEGFEKMVRATGKQQQLGLVTAETQYDTVGGMKGQERFIRTQTSEKLGSIEGLRRMAEFFYGDRSDASVQKYAAMGARGYVLDQEAVNVLQGRGIKGLEAGMKVNAGVSGDGKYYLTAEKQDGTKGVTWKDGMRVEKGIDGSGHAYESIYSRDGSLVWRSDKSGIYEKTVLTSQELLAMANAPGTSKYTKSMLLQAAQFAERNGGSMAAEVVRDTAGRVVSVNALGGGAATLQSVKRDWNYSEELSGSRKQRMDIDTKEIDHGYKFGDTVQMALKRDPALYRPIFEARTKEEREAVIAAISSKMSDDIRPYWSQEGINLDRSEAGINISKGTPDLLKNIPFVPDVEAHGGVGIQSTDQLRRSLVTGEFNRRLHDAYDRLKDSNMSVDKKAAATADEMRSFVSNKIEEGASKTPQDYGSTALPKTVKDALTPDGRSHDAFTEGAVGAAGKPTSGVGPQARNELGPGEELNQPGGRESAGRGKEVYAAVSQEAAYNRFKDTAINVDEKTGADKRNFVSADIDERAPVPPPDDLGKKVG